MVIDTKNLWVITTRKTYNITPNQRKLLLLLADNEVHTYGEIKQFMGHKTKISITLNRNRLNDKIPSLSIRLIRGVGLELKNKMLVK